MKSLRLRADGVGNARLESLALPFIPAGPTVTDDDRAHMPPPEAFSAYRSLRIVRRADGTVEHGPSGDSRLVIIVSGALTVSTPDMEAELRPGDVLLIEGDGAGQTLTSHGDHVAVEVMLAAEWAPGGVVPPPIDDGQRDRTAPALMRHLHVVDDQGQLAPFDHGAVPLADAVDRPVAVGRFMVLSPGLFGDWHTEDHVSLVVVLSGGFEIEVGGASGAVETFRAGDVCLVQDQHGQGHITRTHGETRFAAFVIPDEHVWPVRGDDRSR